jgi:RNA polymerase sigma-70 factor (ECF subfamily)
LVLPGPSNGGVTAQPLSGEFVHARTAAETAFEQLYSAACPKVYAFIRCQVASAEMAQDLVSRVFVKAYRHRSHQPPPDGMTAWIFRIARTTLIDYWRVEKRRDAVTLPLEEIADLTSTGEDPQAAYERKARGAHIVRVLNGLRDDDRMLLALKFAGQRTNREIAVVLSISEGAVSMRLLRALRQLRKALRADGWG